MSKVAVTVSGKVQAPAEIVYNILADYNHHRNILPPQFTGLDITQGGVGAGTEYILRAKSLGGTTERRMTVSEPEPGSVLVERDVDTDLVTTFTVKLAGATTSDVTIETVWPPEPGLKGAFDRYLMPFLMRMVYRQELDILDEYAQRQARLGQMAE